MYATCTFCLRALRSNELLEAFPVGLLNTDAWPSRGPVDPSAPRSALMGTVIDCWSQFSPNLSIS